MALATVRAAIYVKLSKQKLMLLLPFCSYTYLLIFNSFLNISTPTEQRGQQLNNLFMYKNVIEAS